MSKSNTPDDAPIKSASSLAAGPSISVLVVEDRKESAEILGMFFQSEGHRARVAYNGQEAVNLVFIEKPDLILMDLSMPEMNGLDASKRIREIQGDHRIVIVALTAYDDDDSIRQCQECGIDLHMPKPANPNRLRALIREYF